MQLQNLGWDATYAATFDKLEMDHLVPARVVRQDRHRYQVLTETGSFTAEPSGSFRQTAQTAADFPTVGDWVAVRTRLEEGTATLHAVLPRTSAFSRKVAGETTREQVVAANVDTVFLVSGLDHDFNLRRIERYVTLAWNSGAMPVILLNKADLCANLDNRILAVESVALGIDIIPLSAAEGTGLEALQPYLKPGHTVAFLGSSGVGKSTLVNRLLGTETIKTGAVREDDSRGRHTTSSRELHLLPGGALVIDTPGMRELQLWADEESVQGAFSDIEALATACKFRDCMHESEPDCAVQTALTDGTLDPGRFQSYQKLKREVAYLDRRKSESKYEDRKRDRALGKLYKTIQRHNRKR